MAGKGRKGGKKRKNQVEDDEPEFVGTMNPQETQPQDTQLEEPQPQTEGDKDATEQGAEKDYAAVSEEATKTVQPQLKKHRGPTRMKDIAKDPNTRIRVQFTEFGEPCGEGSVKLSSYLGPLVREHVPIMIDDWRKIGEKLKTVLWESVKIRFELDGEYEKAAVMKQMGCLWRASKSRLVKEIRKAPNNVERMKLQPDNMTTAEWKKFVKEKTGQEFKAVSDSYKERRRKQIPHTCSRRGMVRLADDLRKQSSDEVTRMDVWVKSRTKKDGTTVNMDAASKIEMANEFIRSDPPSSSSSNPKEDTLAKILGPDNPGRLRAMGRGMSITKLACFQMKSKYVTQMEQNQFQLQKQVNELQDALGKLNSPRQFSEVGEHSVPRSVNQKSQPKCILFAWSGPKFKVAEGRILSSDPMDLVNNVRLGPNAVKVLVETAIEGETFLWRPSHNMSSIGDAVGETISWPDDCVDDIEQELESEDIPPKSTTSINKCILLDWRSNNDKPVAEGRWQTRDPKALVNDLPLGPNAIKDFVDSVNEPETFLWRPTEEHSNLYDSLKSFVSWPCNRVLFEGLTEAPATASPRTQSQLHTPAAPMKSSKPLSQSSSGFSQHSSQQDTSPKQIVKEDQKCRLLDITGQKRVVAEGRWSSNSPEQLVHSVPLGHNAVRVWIDVVKVPDAKVWRPNYAIECIEDAIGTTLAWPEDKVVII